MPLIAITACRKPDDYSRAVADAGGTPRLVDASMDPSTALAGAAGVLLTGGDDIAPARYGEPRHASVIEVEAGRDAFEIAVALEARRCGLPLLGVCRGIQVLNVACGGSLVQDIPSQRPGALEHSLDVPPHLPWSLAHQVRIEPRTRLARLLGGAAVRDVNSRHHQAVKQVAPSFVVSAAAPDGVVEAIEDPAAAFCLGVQWHPESFWRTGEFRPLFLALVEAAGSSRG